MEVLRQGLSKALMSMGARILPPNPEQEEQARREALNKKTAAFHKELWDLENTFNIPSLLNLNPQEHDLFHQRFANHEVEFVCQHKTIIDPRCLVHSLDPKIEAFLREAYVTDFHASDVGNHTQSKLEREIDISAKTLTRIINYNETFAPVKTFLFDNVTDTKNKQPHLGLQNYPKHTPVWQAELSEDVALLRHAEAITRFHAILREGQGR